VAYGCGQSRDVGQRVRLEDMDQETIQKIAAEIARQLSNAWVLLLIQTVLLLIAAGVGAFLSKYLKTRGRNLATKADFDSLSAQLRAHTELVETIKAENLATKADFESLQRRLQANTALVETIKAEVGQKDWARHEWTSLRRVKMEALLTAMHDCDDYLRRLRSNAFSGKALAERNPQSDLDTIAALYLPELQNEVSAFSATHQSLGELGSEMGEKMLVAGTNAIAHQKILDDFRAEWRPRYEAFLTARDALRKTARELLVQIMGVTSPASNVPDVRPNDRS